MRPMNQRGKLSEPGLPKTKPISTAIDAKSQLTSRHGTRPIQKQGWGAVKKR